MKRLEDAWSRLSSRAVGVVAVLLLLYATARALCLPFVIDEAVSFMTQAVYPYRWIVECRYPSGNNHILNSLLMRAMLQLVGPGEFWLRLPILLASVAGMLMTVAWGRRFASRNTLLLAFMLLHANPYVVEFYSLCRGYGLALPLQIASIYWLCTFARSGRTSASWLALSLAAVACIANFTFLVYYAALAGVCLLLGVFWLGARQKRANGENEVGWLDVLTPIVVVSFVLSVTIWFPLRKHMAFGMLHTGASGFWGSSVRSLVLNFLHLTKYGAATKFLVWGVSFLPLVSLPATVILFLRRYREDRAAAIRMPLTSVTLLTVGAGVGIACFALARGGWLESRTCLFLLPPYVMHLTSLLSEVSRSRTGTVSVTMVACLACLALGVHFVRCANISYAMDYRFDASTVSALENIDAMARVRGKQVEVCVSGMLGQTVQYNMVTRSWPGVREVIYGGNRGEVFLLLPEIDADQKVIQVQGIRVIKQYRISGAVLCVPEAKADVWLSRLMHDEKKARWSRVLKRAKHSLRLSRDPLTGEDHGAHDVGA